MRRALALAVGFGILAVATPSISYAQATRTWVSGIGDDVNPCSRTAPCKTFAGAISKTAAGGQISCLDNAGFGGVTITKSLTIDCTGTNGGALAGGNGIFISGVDIVVKIRGLDIFGVNPPLNGIRFFNGKSLVVSDTRISGFPHGIWVNTMPGKGSVVVENSTITGNIDGIRTTYGVTTVHNSVIAANTGFGLIAEDAGTINADDNVLANNTTAVQAGNGGAAQGAATVRITNNKVYDNLNGFVCGGGIIASDGSNYKGNNTGGLATPCAPNGTITKQ